MTDRMRFLCLSLAVAALLAVHATPAAAQCIDFPVHGAAAASGLSVSVADDPDPVAPDGGIYYTITVTNAGPGDVTKPCFTDPVPAGTTFAASALASGWICRTPAIGDANGAVYCDAATLPPGSAVFVVIVQVPPDAAHGSTISNTATVTSTSDAPASATATTTVQDPAAFAPVPTLGTFGLVLLAALLALGGATLLRKRAAAGQ